MAPATDAFGAETPDQLCMVWPEQLLQAPPTPQPLSGYHLRLYEPGDEEPFCTVMAEAGWPGWDKERLQSWVARIVPDSWFMALDTLRGRVVGTCMGLHDHTPWHPFGGELGWLAVDPAHTGQGIGRALAAAVTARLIGAGYRHIHLYSEDYRLAALRIYLSLGYQPRLYTPDMAGRWEAICAKLGWPYAPDAWPR